MSFDAPVDDLCLWRGGEKIAAAGEGRTVNRD